MHKIINKLITASLSGVSTCAVVTAHAAAPGFYISGQLGYAQTHLASKTDFTTLDPSTISEEATYLTMV